VGVVLEVAQGGLEAVGFGAGQGEGAGGGADRGDVAVVEVGEPLLEPVLVVVAEDELQEPGELVQVLAGVVEVDDLGGLGEVPGGQVPDLIPVPRLSRGSCDGTECNADLAKDAGIISAVLALGADLPRGDPEGDLSRKVVSYAQ
jgi:hypothetical protein